MKKMPTWLKVLIMALIVLILAGIGLSFFMRKKNKKIVDEETYSKDEEYTQVEKKKKNFKDTVSVSQEDGFKKGFC